MNALAYGVNSTTDIITGTITTGSPHYIKIGDTVDIAIGDNEYTRELDVKIINDKYHFKYFDVTNFLLLHLVELYKRILTITGGTGLSNGNYTNIPLIGGTGQNASATSL